jgi:hypothetical protein
MKPKPQEKNKKATDHPTQRHWHEMNRKQRRETMRKIQSEEIRLEVVHPDAAGIDIGNEFHSWLYRRAATANRCSASGAPPAS